MDTSTIGALSGASAAVAGAAAGLGRVLYNRFKRSGSREIESFAQYAAQGIKYYIGRYVRRRLAAELTLRQYAKLQLQTVARDMFVPATIPVRLKVDQAFIPLLLRDSLQEQIEYSDLLDRAGRRLIILGEPGSGKSSLFKRLFRDACRRAASSPRKAPVPILFELRNLTAGVKGKNKELTGDELFSFLQSALRESAVYRAAQGIEDLEHGAGLLILLDGLDEVPDALSHSIVSALLDMCQSLGRVSPNSTVLLSSRTQYFFSRSSRNLQESFDILSVRPFTVGDIYSFLSNWPFAERARENMTRIFSRLRQLPSLTEMCTNPLALSMFVARDQQTGGSDLPETRSRFYESLLEELIINRRSRGEGLPAGRQRLRDARQAVLGPVCLEHLLSRDEAPNSIPRARFIGAITQVRYGGKDADKALLDLSSDTGLFAEERSGETERFMHLTLCEFLAAVEVVETGEEGWDRLFSLLGEQERFWESRLAEVVAFACGIAGRALRQRILADLAKISVPQVMLKAVIEAQAYDDSIAYDAIGAECRYITEQPPEYWSAEWFSRLRTIVGVLRDAHAGRSAKLGSPQATELPTSSDFLMNLIERYNAEEALLETLARQDADAAINIASETQRRDLMRHVASAADDFAVLQGILSMCDERNSAWRAALSERALIDKNIARILGSIQGKEVTGKPRDPWPKWAGSGILKDSVYGNVLDEFLGDRESWSDSMVPFLSAMSKIRPSSLWGLAILRPLNVLVSAPLLVLGVIGIGITIEAFTLSPQATGTSKSGALVLGAVSMAISVTSLLVMGWRSRYLVKSRITGDGSGGPGKQEDGTSAVLLSTDDPIPALNAQLAVSTGASVGIDRVRVLSEILNMSSYSFHVLDRDSIALRASRWVRFSSLVLYGIPPSELRCLLAARAARARD